MRRLFASLLLSGCLAHSAWDLDRPPPVPPERLILTAEPALDRETTALGVVDYRIEAATQTEAYLELREWAADLGADAVVSASFTPSSDHVHGRLRGIAVRYCSPDARPYQVIGPLETATTDDDEAAFDELLAEAYRAGADEVIDISLQRDARGRMHVRGLAVRRVDE